MEGKFVLHKAQIPNILEEVSKIIELSDVRGWTLVGTTENVNCFARTSDDRPDYVMCDGIVHTSVESLLKFFKTNATELDPTLIQREEVQRLSDKSRIVRLRYRLPAMMSNREFVIHEYNKIVCDDPKIGISAGISVDHSMCNEDSQFIRGIIFTSGYVFKEISTTPPRTHLSYVIQADLKGWLPDAVVNMFATDQALNVLLLKQYFAALSKESESTFQFPSDIFQSVDQDEDEDETGDNQGETHQFEKVVWRELADDVRSPVYKSTSSRIDWDSKETLLGSPSMLRRLFS